MVSKLQPVFSLKWMKAVIESLLRFSNVLRWCAPFCWTNMDVIWSCRRLSQRWSFTCGKGPSRQKQNQTRVTRSLVAIMKRRLWSSLLSRRLRSWLYRCSYRSRQFACPPQTGCSGRPWWCGPCLCSPASTTSGCEPDACPAATQTQRVCWLQRSQMLLELHTTIR